MNIHELVANKRTLVMVSGKWCCTKLLKALPATVSLASKPLTFGEGDLQYQADYSIQSFLFQFIVHSYQWVSLNTSAPVTLNKTEQSPCGTVRIEARGLVALGSHSWPPALLLVLCLFSLWGIQRCSCWIELQPSAEQINHLTLAPPSVPHLPSPAPLPASTFLPPVGRQAGPC